MADQHGDTLGAADRDLIARRCREDLPAHALALHSNAGGIVWAVLTPPPISPELLRFTICRVAPSVMVMIEDEAARRQVRGLGTVEEAVDYVCAMAAEAEQTLQSCPGDSRTMH